MSFQLLPDLKQDFVEICARQNLSPQQMINCLVFAFVADLPAAVGVKTKVADQETFSSLKMCYGDVL